MASRGDLAVGLIFVVAFRRQPVAPGQTAPGQVASFAQLALPGCLKIARLVPGLLVIHLGPQVLHGQPPMEDFAQARRVVGVLPEQLRQGHHVGQLRAEVGAVAEHTRGVGPQPGEQ